MTWNLEYTDTFGGEANYCWVRRARIESKPGESQRGIMRRAKVILGLSGLRGRTVGYGDMFEFRPYGMATVLFVTWNDSEEEV